MRLRRVVPSILVVALMAAQHAVADTVSPDDLESLEGFRAALAFAKGMSVSVPAHDFVEACLTLRPGSHRRYTFSTAAPLNFNVHYHSDDEVFYLVGARSVTADSGLITADEANIYCWMWENNNSASAELTFQISIVPG